MMALGMAGVLGGRFTALVFMGVSFACTSSGFCLALVVCFADGFLAAGFFVDVFFAVVFFATAFAFAFAAGFRAVTFFVVFAMIGLLCFFSGTTARFSSFFLFVFVR
jgi:hypothetical protein